MKISLGLLGTKSTAELFIYNLESIFQPIVLNKTEFKYKNIRYNIFYQRANFAILQLGAIMPIIMFKFYANVPITND